MFLKPGKKTTKKTRDSKNIKIRHPRILSMEEREENNDEVYNDEAREDLVDNDEISPEEEGFMAGYDEQKEKTAKDNLGDEAYEQAFESPQKAKKKAKR